MSFWNAHEEYLRPAICVGVLILAWVFYRLVQHSIDRFSRRKHLVETDPGAETRFRMIERLFAVVLFFVAVGFVFWILDLTFLRRLALGMFASAGVVGIAIGFAAQATLGNLAAGIMIAFAQPVRLSDMVEVEGENGTVESIGLFYTYIRTWDNRRLVIPNKILSERIIRNHSLVDPRMPAVVVLRFDYGVDIDKVRSLLLEVARLHPLSLAEPGPVVQVIDTDDAGVTIRLLAWAATPADAPALTADVRETAIRRLASMDKPVDVRWSKVQPQAEKPS